MRQQEYKKQYYINNKDRLNKLNSASYYAKKQSIAERSCCNCGIGFKPKRIDNKFCTTKCGVVFWRNKNKEHTANYHSNLYKNSLKRRLSSCLRSRLNKALNGNVKSIKTMDLLSCSIEQLKIHLESKFQLGMTWENYGEWHIDHIIPLSSFDLVNSEELKRASHYSNLQPLWAKDNIAKGAKL